MLIARGPQYWNYCGQGSCCVAAQVGLFKQYLLFSEKAETDTTICSLKPKKLLFKLTLGNPVSHLGQKIILLMPAKWVP